MSGGRWGCGAIAWSGGGVVRGNVTGWSCVPRRVVCRRGDLCVGCGLVEEAAAGVVAAASAARAG